MTMTTRTVVLRERVSRVEDRPIEVTFPVYRKDWDDNYSGTAEHNNFDILVRVESNGRVTKARRTYDGCREDSTSKWEITTQVVEDSELGQHLARGEPMTADEFEARLVEARA